MAAMALLLWGAMSACTENNPYPGYQKTENGLYYQIFTQNEGELLKNGELVEGIFSCYVNDSVYLPVGENILMLQESQFKGDLFEGLAMLHIGDSASFIVNIDSTFKHLFGMKMPEQYKSTDVMRFNVKVKDSYPESVFFERMVEQLKTRNATIKEQMNNDYPDESVKAEKDLQDYLAKNKIEVEPTQSGLYYIRTQEGNGEKPRVGQMVTVHYTGKLLDGKVFDSSVERGEPINIPIGVGRVIPGWDEGILMMSKGEKGVLYIPYYLAYGQQASELIPAFSNLIFDVELVGFE